MVDIDVLSAVFLGIMVGIFHAFDADHIVAMATLVNQKSKKKQVLKYAMKWGGGHGGILLVLGCLLAFVGLELPEWFVHYSEMMVGVLLVYLGVRLWFFIKKYTPNKISEKSTIANEPKKHDHMPLLIGMLHGVAGSASVLALLPNMAESQFILHIALFSLGCLFGMFGFGLALGAFQVYVQAFKGGIAQYFARAMSIVSISLGTYWVFG